VATSAQRNYLTRIWVELFRATGTFKVFACSFGLLGHRLIGEFKVEDSFSSLGEKRVFCFFDVPPELEQEGLGKASINTKFLF